MQIALAALPAEYDSAFARFAFEHAAASYSTNPLKCIGKYGGTSIVRQDTVLCDHFHDKCWYYISESPNYIVVAFRGTRSKLQLIAEILASMTEPKAKFIGGGSVQRYFHSAFESVWPDMWHSLRKLTRGNVTRPVLFTGHSLGGALASLASTKFAYFCYRRGVDVDIRLVTFGEPRPGNRNFAFVHDALVPNSFRIVHQGDLIPHLPNCLVNVRTFACISRFNFGPYHHGIEIWYPQNMTETSLYRICLDKPRNEDQTCSNSIYCHYNIHDHLFYFGEHVSEYGISGCIPEAERENFFRNKLLSTRKPPNDTTI
ncbi:unnamed protein product [Gongylonema pulchrum]|uniref:Fungal lipase-type domain-containing protein n=1 Tax=Gongylonema pulchrum TaxID=637853 RepID=A0A3P7M2X7_9BILA|nr:unnamed protein product [Gongylonema pulchrum]